LETTSFAEAQSEESEHSSNAMMSDGDFVSAWRQSAMSDDAGF
jgi:hypothetical protein